MFRILQKIKTYPNTIKIKPILISFALIPILALKCTDSIIDDGPVTNTPKFEWVTDTLWARDAQQIYMYDIWGTDKNNVWVVGHSDRTKYQIWQWDGQEWKSINPQIVGYRPSYSEIFGFSEEDFWIVGSCAHLFPGDSLDTKGYILHYDGAWKRIDNNNLPKCMSVWGTSSNNMYIGCYEGILLRYDGSNFYKYYSGVDAQIHSIWGIGDSIVYALGNKIIVNQNYTSSIPYLFKYEKDQFAKIDSSEDFNKFAVDIWGYNLDNIYAGAGRGATKYINGDWVYQFNSTTVYTIYGSSANNIFAGGYSGILFHYNGIDWKQIENIKNSETIYSIWCDQENVFAVQRRENFSVIARGKKTN